MSSLHNDLATWAGKARARGQDRIELVVETAEELSAALVHNTALVAACKAFFPTGISVNNVNIPDNMPLSMDFTMGELRAFHDAIVKAS